LQRPVEPGQYVSLGFGQAARDAGIAISMGSRGDAYDNAVAESFFATLKKELIHRQSWRTKRQLGSAIFEYIEAFDNHERRHSTLGMLSPHEYEKLLYAEQNQEDPRKNIKSKTVVRTGGSPVNVREGHVVHPALTTRTSSARSTDSAPSADLVPDSR
jgi:hypothetical protein